jgi:hypothetical protein
LRLAAIGKLRICVQPFLIWQVQLRSEVPLAYIDKGGYEVTKQENATNQLTNKQMKFCLRIRKKHTGKNPGASFCVRACNML